MRLPRVRFTVRRMMAAVAAVATTLSLYRVATYEVSQREAIRIATDALRASDKSFRSNGIMARAYKTCGQAPWTVDFFPAGSRFLTRIVTVSDAGHVGRVTAFKESDRVVSNTRFEEVEAMPLDYRY